MWASGPVVTHKPHQTVLLVHAAPAEAFVGRNLLTESFPGGYAGLADAANDVAVNKTKAARVTRTGDARISDKGGANNKNHNEN